MSRARLEWITNYSSYTYCYVPLPTENSVRKNQSINKKLWQPKCLDTEGYTYISLQLRVQNAVSAQPCVGRLGISLVLLNFLGCNFRLWFETP